MWVNMKLFFFIHSLSAGGAERVTTTLANYWAEKGWNVTVVSIASADSDFYHLDSRIKRIALEIDSSSANFFEALINNLQRIRALRAVLRQHQPNAAVAMMTTANVLLPIAGLGLAVPVIGSERVHPPTVALGRIWDTIRRWSYSHLSGLVAQTSQSADWLRANTSAQRIQVIPNPVSYPMQSHEPCILPATIREELGCSSLVLAAGRLEQQKGFDCLIKAFSDISNKHTDWGLVILGEGKQRTELEHLVKLLGMGNRVCLPGAVGNVGEWYAAADLFVLTSRFEGFPNTLLEALAYGVPSVAVDCETGPRDIIRNEVDGLLVRQNDHSSLVAALDRIISNDEERANSSKRAIEVRDRFSTERVASLWEQFIKTVDQ
jgi:glycosyltransferase involved in cell wall biosynthesis